MQKIKEYDSLRILGYIFSNNRALWILYNNY